MASTSTVAIGAGAIVLAWLYTIISGLAKNIAAAKRSGLPYVISPTGPYNILWLITHQLWLPILGKLPKAWTEGWLPFMTPDWMWRLLFEPVKRSGDMLITVSPGSMYVWVTNAEAIYQITSRREAFPKPLEPYRILELFGRNIITTEGGDWKKHRKVISPGFNEKNNVLVFAEACQQTQGMMRKWTGPSGTGNTTLESVPDDTLSLTLRIISSIGFGVRLLWPGEPSTDGESGAGIYSSNQPPEGYSMTFENALSTFLDHILMVMLTPHWLLKLLPFQKARVAYESFVNWRHFMNDLFAQKVVEAREGHRVEGMDIMGSLVKSSYGAKDDTERAAKADVARPHLSDSDILGNAFATIVAGHETTANAIHFSLMELAINPRPQRLVQKEIQSIFGDQPPETWDYDSTINSLLGGISGAVLNELLRLMPPVIAIPKSVSDGRDQDLTIDGKNYTLPGGAQIALNTIGVHRNPRYWPTQPSKVNDGADDLNDFRPERWLLATPDQQKNSTDSDAEDGDGFGGYTGKSSHARLFNPVRGSYLPFSDGPRSCVGRRLAQVKIMATFAVIFQKYSIELAVDEWATDDEVAKMSDEEKIVLYRKAQEKARSTLRTANSVITLKLHPGFIPVRLVRKGGERFVNIIE